MRLLTLLSAAVMATAVFAAKSWAGTNSYFLQGMFEGKTQIDHIKDLAANGVKVVRLWLRHQNLGCEKGTTITWPVPPFEETLGVYNDQTLDLLDQTLNLIRQHGNGMKVIISPHDANSIYTGLSKAPSDPYTRFGHAFYTSEEAQRFFDGRIRHMLDYKGKYTGQMWKNFHEMIIAFDLQNEPYLGYEGACGTAVGSNTEMADWVCKRARFIRNGLLGVGNPIKIATGGLGGSVETIVHSSHAPCSALSSTSLPVRPQPCTSQVD